MNAPQPHQDAVDTVMSKLFPETQDADSTTKGEEPGDESGGTPEVSEKGDDPQDTKKPTNAKENTSESVQDHKGAKEGQVRLKKPLSYTERQAARAREQERQEKLQYKSKLSDLSERAQKAERLELLAKSDPLAALSALGLTYDQITKQILGDPKDPQKSADPQKPIDPAVLKQEIIQEARLEIQKERQALARERAMMDFRSQIRDAVKDPELEILSLQDDPVGLVEETIREFVQENSVFDKHGNLIEGPSEMPDPKQVARNLERVLVEEYKKVYEKSQKMRSQIHTQSKRPQQASSKVRAPVEPSNSKPGFDDDTVDVVLKRLGM